MKTRIKNLFLLPLLIVGLDLILTGRAAAQTFTTLYTFSIRTGSILTNSDGAYPFSGFILSGKTLYGTTHYGGVFRYGTVCAVNTDGSGFTNLYNFTGGSDGLEPTTGLILSGNTLYGISGPLFAVNTNGSGFTNLFTFTGTDGNNLNGLILSGNTLYGTAESGGTNGAGAIFSVNTNGSNYTNLYSFTTDSGYPKYTNSDGETPQGGLILSGNTLYGTAELGGTNGTGTVFAIRTDGSGFTNLYNFTARSGSLLTNSDGAFPYDGLILSGNTLYGTTRTGGTNGTGTIFAINTDGTRFTSLYSFSALVSSTNSDGANPPAGLILSGSTLYGMARGGGSAGNGTLFAINTNGTAFTNLYNFAADPYNVSTGAFTNSGGALPNGGLILSGNTLYGTAEAGGTNGVGTVFSLSLGSAGAPQMTIKLSGNSLVVSWPLSATGITLQTNGNLGTTNWGNYGGTVVNNSVTNSTSTGNVFFRLQQSQ